MSSIYSNDVSFDVAAAFLKFIGFWFASTRAGEWLRNATIVSSVLGSMFCTWIHSTNLYFNWGDFTMSTYLAGNVFVTILVDMKLVVFIIYKKKFLNLISYMQKNLWHSNYDDYENSIIADVKHTYFYFVCIFSFCTESTVLSLIIRAFISNIGKNETERTLIYAMHLDLPFNMSPYFEIMSALQIWCSCVIGIAYVCFDNIFCIMCLQAAGQFRILQYRLAKMPNIAYETKSDEKGSTQISDEYYATFKKYILQHKVLTDFVAMLEDVFKVVTLGQMLMFSVIVCFVGYQTLRADLSLSWRITFSLYITMVMSHLWVFTYSCDCVMRESTKISSAAYEGPWTHLSMDKFGKMVRKDMQIVILRSRHPSCLTACGFFPVSLETYTKIMSTAMSYFTLLRQSAEGTI